MCACAPLPRDTPLLIQLPARSVLYSVDDCIQVKICLLIFNIWFRYLLRWLPPLSNKLDLMTVFMHRYQSLTVNSNKRCHLHEKSLPQLLRVQGYQRDQYINPLLLSLIGFAVKIEKICKKIKEKAARSSLKDLSAFCQDRDFWSITKKNQQLRFRDPDQKSMTILIENDSDL